jgi:hypothetical protein
MIQQSELDLSHRSFALCVAGNADAAWLVSYLTGSQVLMSNHVVVHSAIDTME